MAADADRGHRRIEPQAGFDHPVADTSNESMLSTDVGAARLHPLTADEVATFVAAMALAFERAAARQPIECMRCEIGGVRIGIHFAGSALADAFRPALAGIVVTDDRAVDVEIRVFDSAGSGIPLPTFSRPVQALIGFRGECAAERDVSTAVLFDHGHGGPAVIDARAGTGIVAIDDLAQLPFWVRAAPLRSVLAMLLQPHGIQLVHGAAVGKPTGVIFLTGYGGSGKSTTSLWCHRRGLTVLGDDYVALKAPRAPLARPTAHRVYASLKLNRHEIGEVAAVVPAREKAVLFPFAAAGESLCREAPCHGFWSARLAHTEDSWLEPRHPEDVARIAISSTRLQIPGDDEEMSRLVAACAQAAITTEHLQLGVSRHGVVDVIERCLDGATPRPAAARVPVWDRPNALRPVSVIIPVCNGASFIAEALQNVAAQDYPDLEIIVVDDGSTDGLDEVLAEVSVPFRLVRQANRGPAAARNTGIKAATHEWIAFQDVDDLWSGGALRQLARDLVLHADASVVYGRMATLYPVGESGQWSLVPDPDDLLPYRIHGGLYRRNIFERIGGFDESLRYGEGTEWYVRLKTKAHAVMIADVIVHRRRHGRNMTNDVAAFAAGSRAAWKKILVERMRARRGQ